MSYLAAQFDFLKARPVAMTSDRLDIPAHPDEIARCQDYAMFVGDQFVVYSHGHTAEGHYVVRGWLKRVGDMPRRVDLENVLSNERIYLSGYQISVLEAQGRIRAMVLSKGDGSRHAVTPGLNLAFQELRRKAAERRLGYVKAYCDKIAKENGGAPSRALGQQAIKEHAETRGERPPSYSSVWEWVKRSRESRSGDVLLDLADDKRPGNPGLRGTVLIEQMIEKGVVESWQLANGTWKTVRASFNRQVAEARERGILPRTNPERGEAGHLWFPSERTFQRRKAALNHYDRLCLRYDEETAERELAFYIRQHLPDHPLDIVDVDHVELDIVVIDDQYPIAFGRPDLVVFRDRRTGSILGYFLSFMNPSYESFMLGLRHAMFPKDMSAYPGLDWYAWGRFGRLGVDNAFHLIGDSITHAAKQIGFEIVEYRPGHPWEKGALEQLNGMINSRVSHGLPGSVSGDVEERAKHARKPGNKEPRKADEKGLRKTDEKGRDDADRPVLYLSEVESFLVSFWCGTYSNSPQSGLGFLRSLKGVPRKLWTELIEKAPNRPPIDPAIFVRLAGIKKSVHIGGFGIRIDHIIYVSDELLAMRAHRDHKEGEGRHRSTKYEAIRDPGDLGRIYVFDPYRQVTIEVRACGEHYAYANGRRLFEHTKIIEYHRETHGRVTDVRDLQAAIDDYENQMLDLLERRKKHGVARKLAAFVARTRNKIDRSEPVRAVTSPELSGSRIDPANPAPALPTRPRAYPADTRMAPETGRELTAASVVDANGKPKIRGPGSAAAEVRNPPKQTARNSDGGLADLEFLKSKHKGYE